MNTIFRVDSSSTIGIGHLMRCLVLAEQYQKDEIIFAVRDLEGNINHKIIDSGYKIILLKTDSIDELCEYIDIYNIRNIIFDHYGIDYKYEKSIKDKTGIHILSLDDNYQKHYCDILLNHNIYADETQYKNLVPKFCDLRCGKKYTLIHSDFRKIKTKNHKIKKKNLSVFVCLGGSDNGNVSLLVLKKLIKFESLLIDIATTKSNRNINSLQRFANKYQNINLFVDCNIAELMCNNDFAIISSSVIVHEVMFLNLPFIAIKTAVNQEIMHQYLFDNNHPVVKEDELNKLSKEIKRYV